MEIHTKTPGVVVFPPGMDEDTPAEEGRHRYLKRWMEPQKSGGNCQKIAGWFKL